MKWFNDKDIITEKELIDATRRNIKDIYNKLIEFESRLTQLEVEVRIGCDNRLKKLENKE